MMLLAAQTLMGFDDCIDDEWPQRAVASRATAALGDVDRIRHGGLI